MVDLNILQLNFQNQPKYNNSFDFEKLTNYFKQEFIYIDIIVITEIFEISIIDNLKIFFNENKWISVNLTSEIPKINGGIIIASKWPIISKIEDYYINCDINDCLTCKGPIYLKVKHPMFIYNIIGNSFQSESCETRDIRRMQINQLSDFVKSKIKLKYNELFFIIGNFNINNRESIYKFLNKKLKSTIIENDKGDIILLNMNNKLKVSIRHKIDNFIENNICFVNFELSS